MARYTYDDFRKNAQNSGLLNEFSQADLQMAQKNPDFGMSILKYKQDYHNATTDEARALANLNAENLRSSWGSYTGGSDGGSFTMDLMSPRDFQYEKAPTYSGSFNSDIADLWEKQKNFDDFSYEDAPTYQNRYDPTIQEMIAGILERPDFSYDPATDPLYQNYRKQYTREGQRATADALGAASAASAGIPSSYANTAAAQAGNYYAAQMTDKIPELYQLAYNKYLNDYDMALSDLGVVQGAEQSDYQKYLDALGQFNTDRDFAYNVWQNEYNRLNNDLNTAMGLQNNDFNQYLAALDQFNTDRNFAYGQFTDELTSQANERAQERENAILAGEYGDYSFLNNLGINTDNNPLVQQQNAEAQALAQVMVDNMLQTGTIPSAELLQRAGYSQEYANALAPFYRNQLAQQASTGRSSGRSSGSSGSRSSSKPRLTLSQALQAIEDGRVTDAVVQTYDYYMGDGAYNNAYGVNDASDLGDTARNIYNNMIRRYSYANAKSFSNTLASAVNEGRITEDEAMFIANALGFYD